MRVAGCRGTARLPETALLDPRSCSTPLVAVVPGLPLVVLPKPSVMRASQVVVRDGAHVFHDVHFSPLGPHDVIPPFRDLVRHHPKGKPLAFLLDVPWKHPRHNPVVGSPRCFPRGVDAAAGVVPVDVELVLGRDDQTPVLCVGHIVVKRDVLGARTVQLTCPPIAVHPCPCLDVPARQIQLPLVEVVLPHQARDLGISTKGQEE